MPHYAGRQSTERAACKNRHRMPGHGSGHLAPGATVTATPLRRRSSSGHAWRARKRPESVSPPPLARRTRHATSDCTSPSGVAYVVTDPALQKAV